LKKLKKNTILKINKNIYDFVEFTNFIDIKLNEVSIDESMIMKSFLEKKIESYNSINIFSVLIKLIYSHYIVMFFLCYLIIGLFIAISAAILTYEERKVMAAIQSRTGPAKVGFLGNFQFISDAVKMILKEFLIPLTTQKYIFVNTAVYTFWFSTLFWTVLPYGGDFYVINLEFMFLIIFFISLLHVYTILIAGWASSSKYSFLGAIRTVCQLISYDIVIILNFITYYILLKDMNLNNFSENQTFIKIYLIILVTPLAITMAISFLAEANRHPFDLPEAEAELVAGYNVEYSAMRFGMFFLAEYSNLVFLSIFYGILFFDLLNTYSIYLFIFKSLFFLFIAIYARAFLPRYRYDQLMRLCWKVLIPISCLIFLLALLLVYLI